MSNRKDVIDGRDAAFAREGLIYTELLGWVDLGHARGDDIRTIMSKMRNMESSGQEYYDGNVILPQRDKTFVVLGSKGL